MLTSEELTRIAKESAELEDEWPLVGRPPRLSANKLAYSTRVEEARKAHGEDRIVVRRFHDRTIFVVADGAGGISGGAIAAETVCNAVLEQNPRGGADWSEWLTKIDRAMTGSKSSGVAAVIVGEIGNDGSITGASVGDCEAWIFGNGTATNLTSGQARKPLLGEGSATPVGFEGRINGGTLVVATDGLWKYMDRSQIVAAAKIRPLEKSADALMEGVRLKNGSLQDDVALLVAEILPPALSGRAGAI